MTRWQRGWIVATTTEIRRLSLSARLQRFRDEATARGFGQSASPKEANWTKAFFELYAGLPLAERQARSFAYALTHEPVYIHPHTRLAGQTYQRCPGAGAPDVASNNPLWADFSVNAQARRLVAERLPENAAYSKFFNDGASPGHVGWDWGMLLERGAQGLRDRHAQSEKTAPDPKAREFHRCVQISLDALIEWAALHARRLREMAAKETDPARKAELLEMAGVCERAPRFRPARSARPSSRSSFSTLL